MDSGSRSWYEAANDASDMLALVVRPTKVKKALTSLKPSVRSACIGEQLLSATRLLFVFRVDICVWVSAWGASFVFVPVSQSVHACSFVMAGGEGI